MNHCFKNSLTMNFVSGGPLIACELEAYGEKMLVSVHF